MSADCMYCKQAQVKHHGATMACPLMKKGESAPYLQRAGWALTHYRECSHAVKVAATSKRRGAHLRCLSCGETFCAPKAVTA